MPRPKLDPFTFTSGGFFEEGFYRVKEARFVRWDYDNNGPERTFARLTLAPEEGGEARVQYWSVADLRDFVPSDDGMALEQVGRKVAPNDNSNFAELMRSYISQGLDRSRIDDDLANLFEGALLYLILQDAPERAGLVRTKPANAPDNWKPQIVAVGEVREFPWDAAAAQGGRVRRDSGGAGGGGGTGRTPATRATPVTRSDARHAPTQAALAVPSNDGTEAAEGEVLTFLLETLGTEGPLERGVLTTRAMQRYGTSPNRARIVGLLNNEAHLKGLVSEGFITITGTTIGLGA